MSFKIENEYGNEVIAIDNEFDKDGDIQVFFNDGYYSAYLYFDDVVKIRDHLTKVIDYYESKQ